MNCIDYTSSLLSASERMRLFILVTRQKGARARYGIRWAWLMSKWLQKRDLHCMYEPLMIKKKMSGRKKKEKTNAFEYVRNLSKKKQKKQKKQQQQELVSGAVHWEKGKRLKNCVIRVGGSIWHRSMLKKKHGGCWTMTNACICDTYSPLPPWVSTCKDKRQKETRKTNAFQFCKTGHACMLDVFDSTCMNIGSDLSCFAALLNAKKRKRKEKGKGKGKGKGKWRHVRLTFFSQSFVCLVLPVYPQLIKDSGASTSLHPSSFSSKTHGFFFFHHSSGKTHTKQRRSNI